ncbi:MAG: tetratricopeptide (TPR) repeat protein/tRNA A-37 threonylcarbamoyl transferase component Bud32 [Pseudohongiellaceae bacterium]|jgi:tetratricopeptide (TPR) repeat protein/tRNA A-37 threonylcarbamoyl transferase component Bud32
MLPPLEWELQILISDESTSEKTELDTHAVQELFWEVLAQPVPARLTWLAQQDHPAALIDEVRELLAHHSTMDSGLLATTPVARPASAGADTQAVPGSAMPHTIGPFRIVRIIASGGMGTVYEAEQERPRRTVALKVMGWGINSEPSRKRFALEAEALARLRHPGIAQMYAAVLPEDDLRAVPYIVMEHVPQARPITQFVEQRSLSRIDRLTLFTEVCDAVHHGHQRGVIHRDLKPANILVNTEGRPKIIDFGVARLSDRHDAQVSNQTVAGQIIGTISYMSPEQVLADPSDLDTRADVYALGMLLYELLAGRPPYEVNGLSVPEAVKVITDHDPIPLGTLHKRLKGDLEIITAKALAKDRDQRYVSASALAGDLRRFLGGLTIAARRPSLGYQLTRFAQRNRVLVGAAVVVVCALLASTTMSATAARQAQDAERQSNASEAAALVALQAAREAKLAEEQAHGATARSFHKLQLTYEFYNRHVLTPADKSAMDGQELTLRQTLDRAVDKIADVGDSEVRATLLAGFGDVYLSLADYQTAQPLLDRALTLRRELASLAPSTTDPILCREVFLLARAEKGLGHQQLAEELLDEALSCSRQHYGPESDRVAKILQAQAQLQQGQGELEDALKLMEEARRILGQNHPEDDPTFARAQLLYFGMLRFVNTDANVLGALQNMLQIELQREIVDRPFVAELASMTGSFLLKDRNYAEALAVLEQTELLRREVLEPRHTSLAVTLSSKGGCLMHLGQIDQAVASFQESLAIFTERNGEQHPATLQAAENLASCFMSARDYVAAEALLRSVWEGRTALGDGDGLITLNIRAKLGTSLTGLGRFEEAEAILLDVWRVLQDGQRFSPEIDDLRLANRMVNLYETWGKPAEVEVWAQKS